MLSFYGERSVSRIGAGLPFVHGRKVARVRERVNRKVEKIIRGRMGDVSRHHAKLSAHRVTARLMPR